MFRAELMVLVLGGAMNAASVVLYYALTTMRLQRLVFAGYIIAAAAIMTFWVLGKYGFSLSGLFDAAVKENPKAGEKLLEPGLKYGINTTTKIDFISLSLALVLGTAGLPHVLQRFYTVPTAKQARKSVEWAIWLIGGFYLLTLVIGYGAGALVGPETINAAPGKANAAAPLLAFELGGSWLLGIVSGIAFATILAVVAGLTLSGASAVTSISDSFISFSIRSTLAWVPTTMLSVKLTAASPSSCMDCSTLKAIIGL
mgnify:CR=1 FL=1